MNSIVTMNSIMAHEGTGGNKNLLVICHAYTNFQKDPIEMLASRFSTVNVLVRINPIAELGGFFPFLQLERFSPAHNIDLNGIPNNVHVFKSPVWYTPTDKGYKKLGDKHLASVEALIRKQGIVFDLIHAHFSWSSGYVGAKLKERYDVPFVVTAHGYDIYSLPFKDQAWKRNIEDVLNTADAVITVSQSNLECIRKLVVDTPVHIIPNGFREDLFHPKDARESRHMLGLPQDRKILLAVGHLEPVKGHRYLVEAVGEILKEREDILCVIVGAGGEQRNLVNLISSIGLGNFILLAGARPHDEIALWMNAADIFVLPSLRESFGIVQIEAMACGKPVVATRNGGSEEVVTSDTVGLLVEPADADDLAQKILDALDHEWDPNSILAYSAQFAWSKIVLDILAVYNRVGVETEMDSNTGRSNI